MKLVSHCIKKSFYNLIHYIKYVQIEISMLLIYNYKDSLTRTSYRSYTEV